ISLDHPSGLGREGPRERAFFMAEQLAVDDIGWNRLAVEHEERSPSAKARRVNCPRDGLLARARFADDQDRKAVSGGLRGNCEGGAKFRSRADQLLERKLGRELLRYRSELAGCPSPVGIGC